MNLAREVSGVLKRKNEGQMMLPENNYIII